MMRQHVAESSRTRISRDSTARIQGIHARDLAELRTALENLGLPSHSTGMCVADLSLGSWVAHQAARRILEQLGEIDVVDPRERSVISKGDEFASADLLGRFVDAESRGNSATIEALGLAERTIDALSRASGRVVLILAPRFGHVWRADELAYLRFLSFGAAVAESQLLLVACGDAAPPPGMDVEWKNAPGANVASKVTDALLGLIPDMPTRALALAAGLASIPADQFLDLPGGRLLIDPALRQRPSASQRRRFDRLGALAEADAELRAYAQLYGSGYFCDARFLVGQAWSRFIDGAFDIAVDLMDFVVSCTTEPAARARLLYELQGMRIASLRFAEAARAPEPDAASPEEVRGGLLLTKGWGLALSGDAERGRPYLTAGKAVLEASLGHTRQFLYVRNIYALSLARTGDWELAYAEESKIESALDAEEAISGQRDWPLTYVNQLNLARLHKYRGNLESALQCYQRGFSITLGARSESDAVYANFCLAKVYADLGQVDDAYVNWLRAGLHWAAARVPEALAPRVCSAILGRQVDQPWKAMDEVSRVLTEEIARAAEAARRDLAGGASRAVFRRLDDYNPTAPGANALMVGDAGWAVLVDELDDEKPSVTSTRSLELRQLLASLILAPLASVASTKAAKILLPCAGAGEVPTTRDDAGLSAARLGLPRMVFQNRSIAWGEEERSRLIAGRRFARGHAVDAWHAGPEESVTVTFKRFRTPMHLTDLAAKIVSLIDKPCNAPELAAATGVPHERLRSPLDELESKGVLRSSAPQSN
jgi:tetratricopeptide (TPR) repeat protein